MVISSITLIFNTNYLHEGMLECNHPSRSQPSALYLLVVEAGHLGLLESFFQVMAKEETQKEMSAE